jgi:hypothetical protein
MRQNWWMNAHSASAAEKEIIINQLHFASEGIG